MNWLNAIVECRSSNTSCVVVMVAGLTGSAPRAVGTRMVVTLDKVYGTIGGGALELEGISHARALIDCSGADGSHEHLVSTREFNLGKELSQCCGGVVILQFDCHFANDFVLHVFGAGHVGQEVARLALRLPCSAVIHDTRTEWLETVDTVIAGDNAPVGTVKTQHMDRNIHEYVEALAPSAYYFVMTHSHELDLDIVEAVISRADAVYCGLIASHSKAAKFRNRLKRKGFNDAEIQQLSAPLGQGVKTGNTPMEVAIAGIGDVLTVREQGLKGVLMSEGIVLA
ncbi:MAG: xanthine dehydrogenase accessory protein XdhC [Granulosicoccus sp.]